MKTYMMNLVILVLIVLLSGCNDSKKESTVEDVLSSPSRVIQPEHVPDSWYIRIIAEDMNNLLKSESSQLGELNEVNATVNHALKALTPFNSSYLDVVFVNPEGISSGSYKSIFSTYHETGITKWRFTVKTNDSNANIRLSWRGVYVLSGYVDDEGRKRYSEFRSSSNPIVNHMKLIDTKTAKEVPAIYDGVIFNYEFNMNGDTTRVFEWVLDRDNEISIVKESSSYRAAVRRKMVNKGETDSTLSNSRPVLDLRRPPIFQEETY